MKNNLANIPILQPVIVPNNYTLQLISFSGNQSVLYDVIEKLELKDVYSNISSPGQAIFRAGESVIIAGESQLLGESKVYIDTICSILSEINNARILFTHKSNEFLNNITKKTYSTLFPNSHLISCSSSTPYPHKKFLHTQNNQSPWPTSIFTSSKTF